MKMHVRTLVVWSTLGVVFSGRAENIALGKPYAFSPAPNYHLCTDAGDVTQLTDGKYTSGGFWFEKEAVGWNLEASKMMSNPPCITVDLGADMPISGFSWSLASGCSGVEFPNAINVYVSIDAKNWYHVDDLLFKSLAQRPMPPPGRFSRYRAYHENMPCHGRYVKFVATSPSRYCFVDEIEIYRGKDELLHAPLPGKGFHDPARHQKTVLLRNSLYLDAARAGVAERMSDRISKLNFEDFPPGFKTALPINDLQREIFAANSANLRAAEIVKPTLWRNCRWDNLDILAVPSAEAMEKKPITIDIMRGEVRSGAVNIVNPLDREIVARVTVGGFGADTPIECMEVLPTDTPFFKHVSGALRSEDAKALTLTIPAGTSRQLWVMVKRPTGVAGLRSGIITFDFPHDSSSLKQALEVRVHDFDAAKTPSIHTGGWDYLADGETFFKSGELKSKLALHRELGLDIAWCQRGTVPRGAKFNADGELISELDFTRWDAWVERVRGVRYLAVFWNGDGDFYGEKAGTKRFDKMVASYMRAWMKHHQTSGHATAKVILLMSDEPRTAEQAEPIVKWLKPVHEAAISGLFTFEDPLCYKAETFPKEFWENCDIISPICGVLSPDQIAFYRGWAAKGKAIWVYNAGGPSRTYDPVAYYRAQSWKAFLLRSNETASQFWAYGCGGGIGNSLSAYSQTGVEYGPYFVTPERCLDAKQAEGAREGAEDYHLLQLYAARFGRDKTERLVEKAIAKVGHDGPEWNTANRDRDLLDRVRVRMLEQLASER